jgi:hypothetical protein
MAIENPPTPSLILTQLLVQRIVQLPRPPMKLTVATLVRLALQAPSSEVVQYSIVQ